MHDCCMCYWHAAINAYLLPRDMWCNREGKYVFARSLEQEVAEVVEYGKGHEQEQQCHADCLGALHKLVAWLATCNDFDEEEKYMSTIKRWYWQYVHKGEHERNECRKFPKTAPIPCCRKQAAYCAKRAYALCTIGSKQIFEVVNVACQYFPPVCETCRYALEGSVVACYTLIVVCQGVVPANAECVIGVKCHM